MFLVLLSGLTVLLDPHAEFGTGFVSPLYADLEGRKLDAYTELASKPDLVILGSSTSMTLQSSDIEKALNKSAFNLALPSMSLGLLSTLTQAATSSTGPPNEIWLGVDAFLTRATALAPPETESPALRAIRALLSRSYVEDTLRSARFLLTGFPEPLIPLDERGDVPEGFQFGHQTDLPQVLVDSAAADFAAAPRVQQKGWDTLLVLLDRMQQANITVVLFIPPMNPHLLAEGTNPAHRLELEELQIVLRSRCGTGIRMVDFNDGTWGWVPSDFYDPQHMRAPATQRVLNVLLSDFDNCTAVAASREA